MLLKSSSTPILGSLIATPSAIFSDSPNNGFQIHHHGLEKTNSSSSSILHSISCRFPDPPELNSPSGMIRRTRSEGNIKDLVSSHHRDAIPSLSLYTYKTVEEDEEEKLQEQDDDDFEMAQDLSFWDHGEKSGGDDKSCSGEMKLRASQPLFLARGLGIDRLASGLMNLVVDDGAIMIGAGSGDGKDGSFSVKTDYGGEDYELEMHYKRAIEEDPGNALILRNYAQFLHQCKGNLTQAEEYYSRAILADPDDAEAISQYGKLVWELHGDFERASTYIERAANMDQNNSFVQAAYASFLWEAGEEEDDRSQEPCDVPFHLSAMASTGA